MSEEMKDEKKEAQDSSAPEMTGTEETQENPGQETPAGEQAENTGEESVKHPGKEKKDPKDVQIEELQDRLKRQMAEFDNYRKRTDNEKSAMYDIGARSILEKILPVLDNLERGLAAMPEEEKGSSFAEGYDKIYKQFVKILEDAGVETIEALGKTFDPDLHNAVMHIDDEQYGENEITQELQKGYKYRGLVVRHSMVQVAN